MNTKYELRKVLIKKGENKGSFLILTDAPKDAIEAWLYTVNERGEKTADEITFIGLPIWYAKFVLDSDAAELTNEDMLAIGFDDMYDLSMYYKKGSLYFRGDELYDAYPTLEEIKRDYHEFVSTVEDKITTKELILLKEEYPQLTISVNGDLFEDFLAWGGTDADIRHIHYDTYGCLTNIDLNIKRGSVDSIQFDAWSNKWNSNFICFCDIDEIDFIYERYLKIAKEQESIYHMDKEGNEYEY